MAEPTHFRLLVMSIFLIIGMCVGLPVMLWALYSLYRHRRGGGRLSAFTIFLLFSDLLELALIPVVVTALLRGQLCEQLTISCWLVYHLFSASRFAGLHFHQLVALEGILSLTHPPCSTHLSSQFCSLLLSAAVWIFVIIFQLFPFGKVNILSLVIGLIPIVLGTLTCMLTYTGHPSSELAPYTGNRRPGLRVLVVAMVTLFILYAPFLFVLFLVFVTDEQIHDTYWMLSLSVMSFRVIADPLLCVLVCRESPRRQTSQSDTALHN